MASLGRAGIETLAPDVQSAKSIATCVAKVPNLEILVNDAGASYSMPVSDLSIDDANNLFDVNLWAQLAVTQTFLPVLVDSKGMIVNQASVVGRAAAFDVKVIDLKTGAMTSNLNKNQKTLTPMSLPKGSIYEPAKEAVESAMRNDKMADAGTPASQWAIESVEELLGKYPALVI